MWFKRKKLRQYYQRQIEAERLLRAKIDDDIRQSKKIDALVKQMVHLQDANSYLDRVERVFDEHEWVNYPLLDIPGPFIKAFENDI